MAMVFLRLLKADVNLAADSLVKRPASALARVALAPFLAVLDVKLCSGHFASR